MERTPIEVVGHWLQNLLDPDVVNSVVAPDATYVSLNTEDAELQKIMPWAGTSHGPQAVLDNLGAMFTRWENLAFNVTTMFGSGENVAVFGDFRYRSNSLGKVVSSPFSILVKVVDGKVTLPAVPGGQLRHRGELPQGRLLDRPDRARLRAVRGRTGGCQVMKVALTGATGFVGSHILTELQEHGHEVTALVRDDPDVVAARGATPAVVDLYDRASVVRLLSDADAAIHTASPGDATSADLDAAVADAAVDAFAGSGRPYLHISGAWVYGDNSSISEESPFNPPALVSWREPIERLVLGASDMRGVVIVSGVAYGDGGGGMPGLLLGSPRDDAGNLIMLGTGQQHWPTVHVADLADFFRRVLEADSARGYYVVGDGLNPTVAELTEAAAVAVGAPGAVPGSDDEARARLGDYFAEVLLLDQRTDAAKARAELDWHPSHPGLVDEFRTGSYRKVTAG